MFMLEGLNVKTVCQLFHPYQCRRQKSSNRKPPKPFLRHHKAYSCGPLLSSVGFMVWAWKVYFNNVDCYNYNHFWTLVLLIRANCMVPGHAGLLLDRSHIMVSVCNPDSHLHANVGLPASTGLWGSVRLLGSLWLLTESVGRTMDPSS
jgi:hypothetical protein